MSDQKEAVREKFDDAAKEDAIRAKSCCGPSCCATAESGAGRQKDVRQAAEDKDSCCVSSCCS